MIRYDDYISPEEYLELRKLVGWRLFPLEEARKCVENAYMVLCVREDDRAIGVVRLSWDGGYVAFLSDVIVLPEYQGKGIGRAIIDTLEKDEFFLRAKRIEIPASITGVPFYLKMGYNYKNGITEPDEEHLIRLEKRRDVR